MYKNTNHEDPSALPADPSGESAPNAHPPEHLEPTNPKYPDHPVYHDVVAYCSYVLPDPLSSVYICDLETIQTAPDPRIKCRELLMTAQTWKQMAPRLNPDGQDSLVDLLGRILELPDELGLVLLGNLRRIFRNFDPGMPEAAAAFTRLPACLRGPNEHNLTSDAYGFTKPGLSPVIERCEALAGYEDALFDMWTSREFDDATLRYEWNHVGSGPIDPAFWSMPEPLEEQLLILRFDPDFRGEQPAKDGKEARTTEN